MLSLSDNDIHDTGATALAEVTSFRCLTAIPPEGCTRVGILPGCPSLDRGSREAKVGFGPQTLRSVKSRSNHLEHLVPANTIKWTKHFYLRQIQCKLSKRMFRKAHNLFYPLEHSINVLTRFKDILTDSLLRAGLPEIVLFSMPSSEWREQKGGQPLTWQRSMKEIRSAWVLSVLLAFRDGDRVILTLPDRLSECLEVWAPRNDCAKLVVSQYFLTHEEVVQRRMLQSARQLIQTQPVPQGPTTGKRSKKGSPSTDAREASEKVQEQGNRNRNEGTEKEDKRGPRSRRLEQTTTKKVTQSLRWTEFFKGMKDITKNLHDVSAVRPPGPNSHDPLFAWLETVNHVAANPISVIFILLMSVKRSKSTNVFSLEESNDHLDTRRTSGRMGTSRTVRSGRETPESNQADLILPKIPRPDSADSTHPLMGKATYVEPHGLQVVGNFMLAFLNLSKVFITQYYTVHAAGNRISEVGLASFLKAMEFQAEHIRSDTNCNGLGLLKLLLRGNSFDDQCPQFTRLMDIVEPRDPLNRLTTATDRDSTPTDRQSTK
ncbi:hypothetical protein T265_08049 [Opisthorchis viverrini]|uniref:Uncharacterized protein n=1 Tax=Opisthorchis viverrini TaxID=6198 RepID=A0A074ZF50_OPIVI|nr:hypothetical protein T265_08049 [Opisthorchis viverrini]KER24257.1 hypothetical protein T265_08049 [Opisthorchis viverrini]